MSVGVQKEKSMLPVFGRARSSGCYSIERDVWLLGDPDAMKQSCQLASDGDDGPIAGTACLRARPGADPTVV